MLYRSVGEVIRYCSSILLRPWGEGIKGNLGTTSRPYLSVVVSLFFFDFFSSRQYCPFHKAVSRFREHSSSISGENAVCCAVARCRWGRLSPARHH